MIADNRTFIDRFKGTFSKTDAVQSRVKRSCYKDEVDNSSLKLKFPATVRSGQYPVIKDLTKAYGEHVVLKMQILLLKEARKFFVGKKWRRKSTMIKAIMKEIGIDAGSLEIGHNAQIVFCSKSGLFIK
jgi:ATP-binding cassette subfamily F protein 3